MLILADIQVKYAQMLTPAHARGIGARGARAGRRCDRRHGHAHRRAAPAATSVLAARAGAGDCPVLVGSGLAPDNARALLEAADGAIVGTSLMHGWAGTPEQVAALTAARA